MIVNDFTAGDYTLKDAEGLEGDDQNEILATCKEALGWHQVEGTCDDLGCSPLVDRDNMHFGVYENDTFIGIWYMGAIEDVSETDSLLTIDARPMPFCPDKTPAEHGTISCAIVAHLLGNELATDGKNLAIRKLVYNYIDREGGHGDALVAAINTAIAADAAIDDTESAGTGGTTVITMQAP